MLSSTLRLISTSVPMITAPRNAPCVLRNAWAPSTPHILCSSSGASGIMFGMLHMNA